MWYQLRICEFKHWNIQMSKTHILLSVNFSYPPTILPSSYVSIPIGPPVASRALDKSITNFANIFSMFSSIYTNWSIYFATEKANCVTCTSMNEWIFVRMIPTYIRNSKNYQSWSDGQKLQNSRSKNVRIVKLIDDDLLLFRKTLEFRMFFYQLWRKKWLSNCRQCEECVRRNLFIRKA